MKIYKIVVNETQVKLLIKALDFLMKYSISRRAEAEALRASLAMLARTDADHPSITQVLCPVCAETQRLNMRDEAMAPKYP